jgi:hypothetical protein
VVPLPHGGPVERRRSGMDEARMRRIEETFADAVAAVPADEPLMEGLVRRAKTRGLRRIVERHGSGELRDLAVAELARREETER